MSAGLPIRERLQLRSDWLLVVATLVLVVFYYLFRADTVGVFSDARGWAALTVRPLPPAFHYLVSAILLAVIPVMAARWLGGFRPRDLGLGLGRVREGLVWVAAGVPLAIVAGRIGAASPEMRAVYPLDPSATLSGFVPQALMQFLYYGSWEVLFRGVLLFGLKPRFGGTAANVIQTALSVTAHFGRPFSETFSAVPAGLLFGWINLRVKSIWYVAVIHWVVGTALDWFVLAGLR